MINPELTPPALMQWQDRVARLRQNGGDVGYLLLEVVYCSMHGPFPVWELEWTACIGDGSDPPSYTSDARLDWRQALAELASGSCPWLESPLELEWLAADQSQEVRLELFD